MMKIVLFLLVLLFLSSCSAAPTPPPTIFPTVTLAPTPSNTPVPTVTATATASPSPAPSHTPTHPPPLTSTVDATTTAIVGALIATVQPQVFSSHASPDGTWRAEVILRPCTKVVPDEWYESAYEVIQIIHLPDRLTVTAADQLQYCGGVGAAGLGAVAWSPNSRYFYFTTAREGVPDGTGGVGWHIPIYRFDTRDGRTEDMGSGPIAPDGQKIASVQGRQLNTCGGLKVLLAQTLDGEVLYRETLDVQQQACAQGYMPYIAWSPDNESFILLETVCDQPMDCASTLSSVDLSAGERETLIADHRPFFVEAGWKKPDQINLRDQNFKNWIYTLAAGQLSMEGE